MRCISQQIKRGKVAIYDSIGTSGSYSPYNKSFLTNEGTIEFDDSTSLAD